ncbi:MAG: hypothetical protein WCC17_19670 [Candidatus Nitrosopolaris sp.]
MDLDSRRCRLSTAINNPSEFTITSVAFGSVTIPISIVVVAVLVLQADYHCPTVQNRTGSGHPSHLNLGS